MNNRMYKLMNWPEIEAIVYAESDKPATVLGPHSAGNSTLYQFFIPDAESVELVLSSDKKVKMEQVDEAGFYAALCTGKAASAYTYHVNYSDGTCRDFSDAYRFGMQLKDDELKAFSSGEMKDAYRYLGAHVASVNGVSGTNFSIWAPEARRVSVVGDFNGWDGRVHQMNRHNESGVFELFIPGAGAGDAYMFEVNMKGGRSKKVIDPYGRASVKVNDELISVVASDEDIKWSDAAYISTRDKRANTDVPMSIYECSLSSFADADRDDNDYASIAGRIAEHVVSHGYTHVELKPVAEYLPDESCGYETLMYYAPTCRYGSPEGFAAMIDLFHKKGIGVILDWTLAHPSAAEGALRKLDGTACYEHADPRQGMHPQWGTLLFNYGRGEVISFLMSNAFYWLDRFHVDGLRIDSLASVLCLDYGRNNGDWIANMYGGHENLDAVAFIKRLNDEIHKCHAGCMTIAEESSAWTLVTSDTADGGLGFTYKWNIGWRDDFIRYIAKDPIYRSGSHSDLTLSMLYGYSDRFILPFDSECGGLLSMQPGDGKMKSAGVRVSLGYMFTHPGEKLICGEIDANASPKDKTGKLIKNLNAFYAKNPALYELDDEKDGFEWINSVDSDRSVLTYIRNSKKEGEFLVVALNFSGIEQQVNVGVTYPGKYTCVFNTDDTAYGGGSKTDKKPVYSIDDDVDGRPYYIPVTLPALSMCVFAYDCFDENDRDYMQKLKQEARAKADEAKENYSREQAKAKAAEKKAADEQKKAEEAYRAAEEARVRAEKFREKALEEMEKAKTAMEAAHDAAIKAEMAAHRLEVTEKSMKIHK